MTLQFLKDKNLEFKQTFILCCSKRHQQGWKLAEKKKKPANVFYLTWYYRHRLEGSKNSEGPQALKISNRNTFICHLDYNCYKSATYKNQQYMSSSNTGYAQMKWKTKAGYDNSHCQTTRRQVSFLVGQEIILGRCLNQWVSDFCSTVAVLIFGAQLVMLIHFQASNWLNFNCSG